MEPPATEQNEHENKEEEHPAHAMAPPMSNPREREEPRSMTTIPVCCCDRILRRLPGPISFSSRHTHGESGEDGGAAPPPAKAYCGWPGVVRVRSDGNTNSSAKRWTKQNEY